ncbi:MAG: YicC family protein [Clostridiales bacterium]|jgi:uncharacterized protein (TIGR00255 family)|nr:YicC family protein [Clostridiales bacterium]
MMRSMTGYGRSERVLYNRKFSVEIRSVNHRYQDLTIKTPWMLNAFEERVRKIAAQAVSRGKITLYITMETFSQEDIQITLNTAVADAYVEQLRALIQRYALDSDIRLSDLIQFPDILMAEKNLTDEKIQTEIWEALHLTLQDALHQFTAMRAAEGWALREDLSKKRAAIIDLLEKIKKRAPFVAPEYGVKLKERLAEAPQLSCVLDETRLLQEIIIMADKACIDEEIIRLESHLDQLAEIMEADGSVGRKLDFLVQEMNREANTIGSKSNDLEITRTVVDLKSEVEKIREQVQNIE